MNIPEKRAAPRWLKRLSAALAILACVAGSPCPGLAGEAFRTGVNRVNLAWLGPAEQEAILVRIAESGVSDVRLSLSHPVDRSIAALKIADRLGLSILLEIQLTNRIYYPPDAEPRPAFGRVWDIRRLSELDLDRYSAELKDAFSRIDAAGIRLAAVEPGNEINISPYNGDLHVYRTRGVRTARSGADLKDSSAFGRGLDKYVAALSLTRAALRATEHSGDAVLVSAGLSDMGQKFADRLGFERVDAGEVIGMLRARGLDAVVDAYGIHLYPGPRKGEALTERITEVLDFCEPEGRGKPCWVTEWGIANPQKVCPLDDSRREAAVDAVQDIFDDLRNAERLKAAFYYDWDTHERYSVFRCGTLSPAGAAATGAHAP